MGAQADLTEEQRKELIELLGYLIVIRQIVEERNWQAATWLRMDRIGGRAKALAAGFAALVSAATLGGGLVYAIYKQLGG